MEDFKTLQDRIQAALVTTTRSVNGLANEDLAFQRMANPSVGRQLDNSTERLLKLSNRLFKSAANGRNVPALDDLDDVDINWRSIVDQLDSLLEKTDTCLDEYTGLLKRKDAPTPESGRQIKKPKPTSSHLDSSMKRANILKPQNAFERKFNNFDDGPWKPLLTTKPHAKVPLDQSIGIYVDEGGNQQYKHPYETEILQATYPDVVYDRRDPIKFQPVELTGATWVDTYEGVLEMLEELKEAKEIAVDLEHHDFRSYIGLLSLMQISTRDKDWIVDTLQPWRHKLEVLNEVFADPSILKVFHGAFMDITWLQRDLGLYVVGLFDTFHACDVLGYPGKSLAFLLKKFADFDADKKYQMADWRIRPLPTEMFYYARSDTHYLLYIYDMVRNELLEQSDRSDPDKDFIQLVVEKSKQVSLQRYEGFSYDPETGFGPRGWFNALVKSSTLYNSEQFAVYKAVHRWRDGKARKDDESPLFIMSQQALADIARVLPVDQKALWSLVNASARHLRPHLGELFAVIQKAKTAGANGPTMMDMFRADTMGSVVKKLSADKQEPAKPDQPIPSSRDLRSERSQLWGPMAISSVWEMGTVENHEKEKTVQLPWAKYIQNTTTTTEESQSTPEEKQVSGDQEAQEEIELIEVDGTESAESGELEESEETEETEETRPSKGPEDEFTLKKNGRKRKAARQGAPKTAEEGAKAEEEPFDYNAAQSILHAASKTDGPEETRTKKAFDPYVKKTAGDGPKGVRSLNYERAGRTATFKK